jgi:hypothetical protein
MQCGGLQTIATTLGSVDIAAEPLDDSSDEGSSCEAEVRYASARVLKAVAAFSPVGSDGILQGPLLPATVGMLSDPDDHVKAAALDALTALAKDLTSKELIAQQASLVPQLCALVRREELELKARAIMCARALAPALERSDELQLLTALRDIWAA